MVIVGFEIVIAGSEIDAFGCHPDNRQPAPHPHRPRRNRATTHPGRIRRAARRSFPSTYPRVRHHLKTIRAPTKCALNAGFRIERSSRQALSIHSRAPPHDSRDMALPATSQYVVAR